MASSAATRRVALVGNYGINFSADFVEGVYDFVEHSTHWLLRGTGHHPFVMPDELHPEDFDGLIGDFDAESECAAIIEAGVPTINESEFGDALPLPRVTCDNHAVGRLAAEHFLGLGFSHVGFFGWPDARHALDRLEGLREVAELRAKLTCHVMNRAYRDSAHRVEMLDEWIGGLPKPIGIFASGNYLALVLAERLHAAGWSVPYDVAILGVGASRWTIPVNPYRLSSVVTDERRQGYVAAQTLDRMMAGEEPPPVQRVAPVGVVTRASTDVTISEDPLVRKALAYIRDHVADGIDVDDVLGVVQVSRSTLSNRMKRSTGQTVHRVICNARVDFAKRLLLASDLSIEQIAFASGFTAQPRLNEVFSRITGMTPSEFRKRRR